MRTTTLLVLIGALLVGPTDGAAADKPKKDKTRTRVKDICKDCVDPYNSAAERARFLTAAGVDSELDAKEFEKDMTRDDGFVRKFDTWTGMIVFDKDSNNTLDWFEADAYRRDVRKRVLSAYDANKDGRLKDKERESANKALSEGKGPKASKKSGALKGVQVSGRPLGARGGVAAGQLSDQMRLRMFDKDKDGKLDDDEKTAMAKWEKDMKKRREEWAQKADQYRKLSDELRKKHDKNGDGRLDEAERKAYYEEFRQRAQVIQWDKDGDGQLSDAERKEMETKQAEWKKLAEENRRKWMLRQWDKDRDGRMSEEESAAMEAHQAEMKKRTERYRKVYEELMKKHDKNGDGQLDGDERKAYYDEYRRRATIIQWDKDGDGRLSDAERREMEAKQAEWKKRAEESRHKWMLQQWDKNKDGELDEGEHKAMEDEQAKRRKRNEEYRRQWELRRWDKNKDGELDEDERKTMEKERSGWRQSGSAIINVSPASAGGGSGVRVWNSPDGSTRGVIIRRNGQDEQDE